MAQPLADTEPRNPRPLGPVDRPDLGRSVGDRADALLTVLRDDVLEAARGGVITSGEATELLARLAVVVDQAVRGR